MAVPWEAFARDEIANMASMYVAGHEPVSRKNTLKETHEWLMDPDDHWYVDGMYYSLGTRFDRTVSLLGKATNTLLVCLSQLNYSDGLPPNATVFQHRLRTGTQPVSSKTGFYRVDDADSISKAVLAASIDAARPGDASDIISKEMLDLMDAGMTAIRFKNMTAS